MGSEPESSWFSLLGSDPEFESGSDPEFDPEFETMATYFTEHARARMQQRGIPAAAIDALLDYGRASPGPTPPPRGLRAPTRFSDPTAWWSPSGTAIGAFATEPWNSRPTSSSRSPRSCSWEFSGCSSASRKIQPASTLPRARPPPARGRAKTS